VVDRRALTGAWIETFKQSQLTEGILVAPSRARGLKHVPREQAESESSRALTGAWIETTSAAAKSLSMTVAPSRARGLKRGDGFALSHAAVVAPSRARGLKPLNRGLQNIVGQSRPHGRVD